MLLYSERAFPQDLYEMTLEFLQVSLLFFKSLLLVPNPHSKLRHGVFACFSALRMTLVSKLTVSLIAWRISVSMKMSISVSKQLADIIQG